MYNSDAEVIFMNFFMRSCSCAIICCHVHINLVVSLPVGTNVSVTASYAELLVCLFFFPFNINAKNFRKLLIRILYTVRSHWYEMALWPVDSGLCDVWRQVFFFHLLHGYYYYQIIIIVGWYMHACVVMVIDELKVKGTVFFLSFFEWK